MKKMISFTFAALLAVTTTSFADDPVQNAEQAVPDPVPAVETMTETEVAEALDSLEGLGNQEIQEAQESLKVREVAEARETSGMQEARKAQRVQKAQRAENARSNAAASNRGAVTKAQSRRATRQEIRSMDILDRPNRPGHFYGNTVRRLHGR